MDIEAYIKSGIVENYCLGFCTADEDAAVEQYALKYPRLQNEIERVRSLLEGYFKSNEVTPPPTVKISIMLSIYRQMAENDSQYPPLIEGDKSRDAIIKWLKIQPIVKPTENERSLFVRMLPSSGHVINFIVHATTGHAEEVHDDLIEYLFVINGSCIMNFDGRKIKYNQGDLIRIMPHIRHSGIVTSTEPMIALVQRQACA